MKVLTALLLTACAYDPGGSIPWREAEMFLDGPGRITGYCASSCVMRLRQDCVDPDALLVIHPPTPDTVFWRQRMADHMPPRIAALQMTVLGPVILTGAEALNMGAIPCAA